MFTEPRTAHSLPQPIHFQAAFRRYHALLLASDARTGRSKIALCDWIMGKWWTLWVSSERVLPATRRVKRYKASAVAVVDAQTVSAA